MAARFLCLFIGPIGVLGVLAGCDARVSSPTVSQENQMSSTPAVAAGNVKQRQADFLTGFVRPIRIIGPLTERC
jgi:hypothetical protein